MKYERLIWIATIILIIIFFRSCFNGSRKPTETVRIDTVWRHAAIDTEYVPEIGGVTNTIHVTKWKTDTLVEYEVLSTDTAAILQRFYQVVHYEDVQPIQYGTVTINDTISQNRITGRRLQVNQSIPEVTKIITKVERRTIGYIGASLIGTPTQPLYAIGADFSLKLKNDRIYSMGVQYGRDNILSYTGGFKLPIRLRK